MSREKLANLIFPEISETLIDLENKYPVRALEASAEVTRFAPSPTGFLHTGSLFTALVAKTVAEASNGVFYVRLEDTDRKREISGAGRALLKEMAAFDVSPNEGYMGDEEVGNYGPYKQSERGQIYKTVIKQMLRDDLAYPCFCTNHDLANMRTMQEETKVVPGYYGPYARCSFLSEAEALARINNGDEFVIRFRSKGDHRKKIKFTDRIKGEIEIAENDQHIVILKSDGLPTYHFAHVCDDHFMHTTVVTRGEEWVSSVPLHIELFTALNFRMPDYAHLPLINKLDNGNRRKLSKRKDPEAAVSYFLDLGYPVQAILTYLMSIANSNFEEWWSENLKTPLKDFPFSLQKMSVDGALFDLEKVNFFAREYIASLTAEEVYTEYLAFAKLTNNHSLLDLLLDKREFFIKILNIERDTAKPRKDYTHYAGIYDSIKFFFADEYDLLVKNRQVEPFNDSIDNNKILMLLQSFSTNLVYNDGNEGWFASLKKIASDHGFALNRKEYKANPTAFNGDVADVAEILRLSIVGSKKSPNMYEVLTILGQNEVNRRLDLVAKTLKN